MVMVIGNIASVFDTRVLHINEIEKSVGMKQFFSNYVTNNKIICKYLNNNV